VHGRCEWQCWVGLGWWEVLKGLHRSASESLLQVSMQGGVLDR
jgi:hypothetical protein